MLSSHNQKEQIYKQQPKKQRFAIKKLTVGVASVLIGFTFMGIGASADTTQPADTSEPSTENSNLEAASQVDKQSATLTPSTNQTGTDSQPSVSQQDQAGSNQQGQASSQPAAAAPKADTNTDQGQSENVGDWQGLVSALNNANTSTINLTGDITVSGAVNGTRAAGITDANKHYLYLTGAGIARNVTINGNNHAINFGEYTLATEKTNYDNAAGNFNITIKDATINGSSSSYSPLSFYYYDLNHNALAGNSVTYENVTANLDNRPLVDGYSQNMTVNLNNVNLTATNSPDNIVTGRIVNVNGFTVNADKAGNVIYATDTANFDGSNSLTVTNMPQGSIDTNTQKNNVIYGNKVNFKSGTTNITADGDIANHSGSAINSNNWMVRAASQDADTVVISEGATLNLKSSSDDMRGIWAGRQTTASQPAYGSVQVAGTLTADMAKGHSTAIWAQNLTIDKTGVVTINTKQDNQADGVENSYVNQSNNYNGTHYAPITIFMGPATSSVSSPVTAQSGGITNNGKLTVIRDNTNKTLVPLIGMGQGLSSNMTLSFINGAGSTLDLQDNSDTYSESSSISNAPTTGMVTMWGTSGTDVVTFTNPAYVNLQRTGSLRGSLFRLEGVNNTTTINGTTPVAQWDQGNTTDTPDYAWYVSSLQSHNQWGNFSNTYIKKGQSFNYVAAQQGVDTLYNSNASATMGQNQSGDKYDENNTTVAGITTRDLNSFLNNFNFWRPQRVAMGTQLTPTIKDNDKYDPEVQAINGNTGQTLSDLNPNDGIKDLIGPNEQPVAKDGIISNVTWYNSATDQAEWNKLMIQPTDTTKQTPYPEPTNPTGNLTTSDKSAWAKVTYADGSVDFVNIPLNITNQQSTLADQYAPEGGTITVDQGHPVDDTDAANAITNKDQLVKDGTSVVAPNGGYTWSTAPSTSNPGSKSGVVKVTYTDGSSDEVPVVVNVKSQADQYTPEGQDVKTEVGTVPEAKSGIANIGALPNGTTYTWSKEPDVSKAGTVPGVINVTYPDGSIDEVPVKVIVGNPTTTTNTDADKYAPQGQDITTTFGNVPDAEKGIANASDMPAGTTYTWSQTPDVYSKGSHPGVISVNYPDGSKDYVPVNVTVTNGPTAKDGVTTEKGTVPDPATTIDWGNGSQPDSASVSWSDEPDVSKAGDTQGTVIITYPNGENTTVVVPVHVTDPSTTTAFDPYGKVVNVKYGYQVTDQDAQNWVTGVPATATNVTYTWASKPNTTVANTTQTGYVNVTATVDGKQVTKTVRVLVNVGDMADNYNPKGQDITVEKGAAVPDAKSGIANADTLPAGTNYTWSIAPDTNTVGTQSDLVKVTYPDGSVDYVPVNVTVKDNLTDADKYQPSYAPVEVNQGSRATATPTWDNNNQPADGDATFSATTNTPSWANVASDGTVTLKPGSDTELGVQGVPVNVTYKDGSSEVVYVPVTINNDQSRTVYSNDTSTTYTMATYDTHKTTNGSVNVTVPPIAQITFKNYGPNWSVRNSVTYVLQGDKYVAQDSVDGITLANGIAAPTSFDAKDVTTAWEEGFVPNTNSDQFKDSGTGTSTAQSQYSNPDGEQRTQTGNLAGNSRTRATITLSGQAASLFWMGSSNWINVFGNIYGATTGEALTFDQNADISNLTQDQYRQLINVTDLGKAGWNGTNTNPQAPEILNAIYTPGTNANNTFWMTWAPDGQPSTATVANGVAGTVRIHFSDGTYLDVPAKINVKAASTNPDDQTFSQKIVYTYNGQEVAYTTIDNIKKGGNLTADQLKAAIDGNVPANYEIAAGYSYPGAVNNITADPSVINVPLTLKSGETFNATGKIVYQTADGTKIADGATIKSNTGDTLTAGYLKDLADQHVPAGYKITTYPGSFDVTADNFTIPVIVAKESSSTPVPYDPNNQDMNKYVTRTINVYNPGSTEPEVVTQKVHFGRDGVKDAQGNITYNDWKVVDSNNQLTTATTGSWAEYDVKQLDNYTSTVDGNAATTVSANNGVTADTPDATVTVAYTQTLKPDDPSINPNNPGENGDMFKEVTRTINVHNPVTGNVDTTTQSVWFGRTKTVSTDPNAPVVYGNWQAGTVNNDRFTVDQAANKWSAFTAPEFSGYTPSQAEVDAETVNADTEDQTVDINYTKTNNGNGGNNGGNSNGGNGTANTNTNTNDNNVIGNNGNNTSVDNNKQDKTLPQTGNTKDNAAIAGLALTSLAAMLGLGGLKKRKN